MSTPLILGGVLGTFSMYFKQDACYTGITRDAGADSFIPTVCFADW